MESRSRLRLPTVLAAAVAFALVAGCGGSSSNGSSTGSTSTPTQGTPPTASLTDWPTYHADNARSGVDTSSPALGSLKRAWSRTLDGAIYGEPLVSGANVFAATENDSVYALDARSGRVVWHRKLGTPVDAASLPCGNISPVVGITGTPVISAETKTIYVVAYLSGNRHTLFALDTASGQPRFSRPLDPPGLDPKVEQQRAALSLSGGQVYVPYGGLYGDCGAYKGAVLSAGAQDGSGGSHFTVGVSRQGGIWAPSGAAIDGSGRLFVATGNGASSGFDSGNSVIGLSPQLKQTGFFRPTNGGALNTSDMDVGSVGPTLLSGGHLFQIGKEGVGYVLSADRLGGVGGQLGQRQVCASAYGGLAYRDPYIYVPCTDGLAAIRVGSGGSFTVAWRAPGFTAGPPIIAGGAVWTIDTGSGTLHALDPASGNPLAQASLGSVNHFATPSASGGELFAPAGDRIVAFGGL